MSPTLAQFKEWYQKHSQSIQEDFFAFLRFKSISTDPAHNSDTRKTASWLLEYLNNIGLKTTLWETTGHPVVYGELLTAGKERPTILIYQHYDVQPVDPLELWHSEPFNPIVRNNQVFARGALDNKGQCFYSISAIKAFLQLAEKNNVNIKVFIEGEEETGSSGTFAILDSKRKELAADHLLVVDTDIPGPGIPGITLGVRGITTMHVECQNSKIDLHSGTHGGIALNPNRALVTALGKMWDASGKVAIPGFYDSVRPFTKEELSIYDLTFDEEDYKKSFGVKAFANEPSYSLVESNWMRPTLEINGISGGYAGAGFKTVIPAKAIAKISCRLVPDQDPVEVQKQIENFLRSQIAKGLTLTVEFHHGAKAYRCPYPSTIAKIASASYEEVFGRDCKKLLCGASIPIVGALAEASGANALMMGMGLSSDDIHAPNEHFGLDRFEQGFLTMGGILSRLSSTG